MYTYRATTVRPSTRMRFARKGPRIRVKEHLIAMALAALIVAVWYALRVLLAF